MMGLSDLIYRVKKKENKQIKYKQYVRLNNRVDVWHCQYRRKDVQRPCGGTNSHTSKHCKGLPYPKAVE